MRKTYKPIEVVLHRPHSGRMVGQQAVLEEARPYRYKVLACGRRWGKSTLFENLAAETALAGGPVGYFAPTYKLLIEYWDHISNILQPVTRRRNATERRIELITGGLIECWTLEDVDAGRSRKYQRVLIDEAGLVPDLGKRWTEAIRPTLADLRGDAWFVGTPKGRNFFWECYQKGLNPAESDWYCRSLPTDDNPHIPAGEIAAMREELPERQRRQEIDAEFLEDGGGVFRGVTRAFCLDAQPEPVPGHTYGVGIDWGRSNDFTVVSIWDITDQRQAHVERFTGIDAIAQANRIIALWERWGWIGGLAESNSIGGPMLDLLVRAGVPVAPFETTNASKQRLIDDYALGFEREAFQGINDAVQIAEHQAYEMERLPSGMVRFSAPEGLHDDTVMAGALGWAASKASDWSSVIDAMRGNGRSDDEAWDDFTGKLAKGKHAKLS